MVATLLPAPEPTLADQIIALTRQAEAAKTALEFAKAQLREQAEEAFAELDAQRTPRGSLTYQGAHGSVRVTRAASFRPIDADRAPAIREAVGPTAGAYFAMGVRHKFKRGAKLDSLAKALEEAGHNPARWVEASPIVSLPKGAWDEAAELDCSPEQRQALLGVLDEHRQEYRIKVTS